jgi:hypothetical protein
MTPDPSWGDAAPCRGKPHALFFGAPGEAFDPTAALALCSTCPVKAECEADAIHYGDIDADGNAVHGVIAGKAPAAKKKYLHRPVGPRKAPGHGTAAGYKQHRRLGTEACEACLAAKAREQQAHRRQRRSA